MIRVLALPHVVLVTTGAMDSSWAMAKSLAMSHARSPRRSGSERSRLAPSTAQRSPRDQPLGLCRFSPEHAQHPLEMAGIVCVEQSSFARQVQIPETR
jgi:hypothetical protein